MVEAQTLVAGEDVVIQSINVQSGVREVLVAEEHIDIVEVGPRYGSISVLRRIDPGTRLRWLGGEFEIWNPIGTRPDGHGGTLWEFGIVETPESFSRRRAKGS